MKVTYKVIKQLDYMDVDKILTEWAEKGFEVVAMAVKDDCLWWTLKKTTFGGLTEKD